jgi:hypothetical protein
MVLLRIWPLTEDKAVNQTKQLIINRCGASMTPPFDVERLMAFRHSLSGLTA